MYSVRPRLPRLGNGPVCRREPHSKDWQRGAMTEGVASGIGAVELAVAIVAESGADLSEVDRLGRQLRAELIELDVDGVVGATSGEPPAGAKGADLVAISELV